MKKFFQLVFTLTITMCSFSLYSVSLPLHSAIYPDMPEKAAVLFCTLNPYLNDTVASAFFPDGEYKIALKTCADGLKIASEKGYFSIDMSFSSLSFNNSPVVGYVLTPGTNTKTKAAIMMCGMNPYSDSVAATVEYSDGRHLKEKNCALALKELESNNYRLVPQFITAAAGPTNAMSFVFIKPA